MEQANTQRMATVGTMVNTIIRDFNTPFALISQGAQTLAQHQSDPKIQKLCHNIENQVKRMEEMTQEIIEFSRGHTQLKTTPIPLPQLLQNFKELNLPHILQENTSITFESEDITLEADETKMIRVLQNLLSNAMDACEDNEEGIIHLSAHKQDNHAILTLSDNGEGIPESIQENFFEPFITHGKSSGTGLGSTIVKSIIEAHGGSIEFTTEVGQGTTFTIKLPLA